MPIRRGRRGPLYAGELLQSPLYSSTCKDAFRIMERLAAAAVRRPGSVRNENVLAGETGLSLPALEQPPTRGADEGGDAKTPRAKTRRGSFAEAARRVRPGTRGGKS